MSPSSDRQYWQSLVRLLAFLGSIGNSSGGLNSSHFRHFLGCCNTWLSATEPFILSPAPEFILVLLSIRYVCDSFLLVRCIVVCHKKQAKTAVALMGCVSLT